MTTYIYALGFFDGVHLGHQALLNAVKTLAPRGQRGVVTFSGHPDTLVLGTTPELINTSEDRERLLRHFGMDRVVTLPFDKKMQSTPWQDFLEELRGDYGAAGFVCGEDFRFGAFGAGSASLLQDYCEKEGLPCAVVPEQEVDDIRVSSTYIRQLLHEGLMNRAVRFLGHPHVLTGSVVHGRQIGRTLGIPTANLRLPEGLVIPRFGVYACRATADGKTLRVFQNRGFQFFQRVELPLRAKKFVEFQGDFLTVEVAVVVGEGLTLAHQISCSSKTHKGFDFTYKGSFQLLIRIDN